MKIAIVFILLMLAPRISASCDIFGELSVKPGIPYKYHFDCIVGGLSTDLSYYGWGYTWEVTGGKIKDQNGNYTLTTLPAENLGENISVIWDCPQANETAMISLIGGNTAHYVYVQPCNVTIANKEYVRDTKEEGMYLSLMNVRVRNTASVSFNGYRSVRILPGFIAERGSKVRIYNQFPTAPTLLPMSATTGIDEVEYSKPELYQNIPNPANNLTTISYSIPEIRRSAYIQLHNMIGALVMRIPVTSAGQNSIDVNTAELTNGVYIYSLIVDNRLIDVKRMMISR